MKKFTFMLLATFIAVAAMAAGLEKRGMKALNTNAVMTSSVKQVTPKTKAVKVQAPVTENLKKLTKKAKANVRKAPKKAEITDLLKADWMLCSDYYKYDEDAGGLVADTPAAGGTPITFEMVDEETIAINGFTSYATEAIQAKISVPTDEELLAEGIIAVASIADEQLLYENKTYGPVYLMNFSAENEGDPIMAYIYDDGFVVIDALWADIIGGDGDYAGYLYSGNYYSSYVAPVNGKMAWGEGEDAVEVPVFIYQDVEQPKNVIVYNFGGENTAVNVTVKEDKTFTIDEQPIFYYDETYGYFCVSGLQISNGNYYIANLTGTGDETTLTFDVTWMLYSPTKLAIYDIFDPATITLLEGEFTYPEIPDVAAVPNNPEIIAVGEYDAEKGYGYVIADVPTTDVDGNDLKESLLTYVLYADIEGEITPITFSPDLYKNLEEDLTEIPYTFTDSYDFDVTQGYKVVYLNYDYSDYNQIGVQSIYYGGGEVNKTDIQWYHIKDYAFTGGDFTFDFNKMDVPVSATGVTDGDLAEAVELTEEMVTLTISPADDRCKTPNRFWGTSAGPQLRVYSGTLTFEVPAGYTMTNMVFNYNKTSWGNNAGNVAADSGEITNDATNHQATWTGDAQSVVFSIGYYDEEAGSWVSGNTQLNSIVVTVAAAAPVELKPVEVPEDLVTEPYLFEAFDTYFEEDVTSEVQVGFYGENEVYIQGLSAGYVPDAWVKGTIEDGVVTIPETYLGIFTYDGDDYEVTFDGATFIYDAENETFTSEEGYVTTSGKYLLDEFANVVLTKISTTTTVTVTDALYATYVAPTDVDFTGAEVTAYAATFDGTYVILEQVTAVPAGTAVIVKATEAGTYEVNKTEGAVLGATNELIAATEDVVTNGTQYILAQVNDKVGFYKATGTIPAGKGYMVFETAVKGFYPFAEDDATGIENLNANANLDGVIYNVAGQRVSKAQKGINIINGKKILK